jgi:hypothetical protein
MPPDPTQLPIATTTQTPVSAAIYNALNVATLPVGGFYADPITGVKIYRLTNNGFPASGVSFAHAYSDVGDEISYPYSGTTRAVHITQSNGTQWVIDFTPPVGAGNATVGNARQLGVSGRPQPNNEIAFAFSSNPATPYLCYIGSAGAEGLASVRCYDFRDWTQPAVTGFPVTGERDVNALCQSANDTFFTWMRGVRSSPVVGYEPSTSTKKTFDGVYNTHTYDMVAPRVDRSPTRRYISIGCGTTGGAAADENHGLFWDWTNNVIVWANGTWGTPPPSPSTLLPFAHVGALKGRFFSGAWHDSYPCKASRFYPETANSGTRLQQIIPDNNVHGSGNWSNQTPEDDTQYGLISHYGSILPSAFNWVGPGGCIIGTMEATAVWRLAFHPYSATANYTFSDFCKWSPDGLYIMFTSDMYGTARSDVFLMEMPVTAAVQQGGRSALAGLRSWNRWAR